MMGLSSRVAALAATLVLFSAAPARASTVIRFTDDELCRRATSIFHGRLLEQESRWDDARQYVYTEYTFEVIEWLKAPEGQGASPTATFHQIGGHLPDRGYLIAGAARFEAGEEVVVFLDAPNEHGCAFTIGLAQGKFRVVRDPETGDAMLERDLEGLSLVEAGDPSSVTEGADVHDAPRRMAEFLEWVRNQVARGR